MLRFEKSRHPEPNVSLYKRRLVHRWSHRQSWEDGLKLPVYIVNAWLFLPLVTNSGESLLADPTECSIRWNWTFSRSTPTLLWSYLESPPFTTLSRHWDSGRRNVPTPRRRLEEEHSKGNSLRLVLRTPGQGSTPLNYKVLSLGLVRSLLDITYDTTQQVRWEVLVLCVKGSAVRYRWLLRVILKRFLNENRLLPEERIPRRGKMSVSWRYRLVFGPGKQSWGLLRLPGTIEVSRVILIDSRNSVNEVSS